MGGWSNGKTIANIPKSNIETSAKPHIDSEIINITH